MDKLTIKIIKNLYINPLVIILLIGAYFGNYLFLFLTAYITATLHELAHIGASVYLKVNIEKVTILPFGISAKLKDMYIKNPHHEILIASAGPAINLIIALLCHVLYRYIPHEYLIFFVWTNLSIATINLVPCLPLDGGRIVKALLVNSWGAVKSFNFTIKLTKLLTIIILISAIFLLLYCTFNFSLILIGAFLIANITNEYKHINMLAMKEILTHKEKLDRSDINNVRTIAVFDSVYARKLLRHFSYNYYYIIGIVNENMKITKFITEGELIDALINKGISVKMCDIP